VKVISVDRKSRVLGLSIKAIEIDDEKSAIQDHKNQEPASAAPTTIGDLIKAEMDKK
jgi:small subunit ribosomal protein S1